MKEPIMFKSEDALWQTLARGERSFDMRWWDMADDRVYRLAWGKTHAGAIFLPEEREVSFLNKATGEILTFEYRGVEFVNWAPGWGFLQLGKRRDND